MTDEQLKMAMIFMPRAVREMQRLRDSGGRFVHYTSADSALTILRSGRMLLRNSLLMNDFSEVQYGMECLKAAYNSPNGERLKVLMKSVQDDLPEVFESNFSSDFGDVKNETYLISISEHGDELEDQLGRLSMWRAYAPKNGVAFVFNNKPFLIESEALNAFSSPVNYSTPAQFADDFKEVVDAIEGNMEAIRPLDGEWLHEMLMWAFRFAVQSTKHPSFREEREWRVIYTPTLLERDGKMTAQQAKRVPTEVMSLGGIPQRVYAIPFKDYPEEEFVGATVPDLIDRILIGPTQDAYSIAQAFAAELADHGVNDPYSKITITGIPLRN
jgi:hypothetical protein